MIVIAKNGGSIPSASGGEVEVDKTFLTAGSVLFDALFVPGGRESVTSLIGFGNARHFVNEAYRHGKPIAAVAEGVELLRRGELEDVQLASTESPAMIADKGIVTAGKADRDFVAALVEAMTHHRHWDRTKDQVAA